MEKVDGGRGHVAALSATLHHSGGPASSAQRQPLPTGFPFLAPKAFSVSVLAPKKTQNNRLDFPEVKNFLVVVEFIVTVVIFFKNIRTHDSLKMFCQYLENLQTAAVCGRRKHANTTLLNVTRN